MGKTVETKWGEMLESGKLRIRKDGVAYSAKGYKNEAKAFNSKLEDVRGGLEVLKVPAISKQFMKNFEHNAKLAEEGKMVGILSYNNRNVIKPLEVVNETLVYEEECKATGQPVTIAGLCHKLRCGRQRLLDMLNQKGYDGARICVHNVLMKYAENYLFTGKNVQGSVFYLKNAFPEFYQDKMTTETNVKISLVDLSKKADKLEFNLKKVNAIKGEVVEEQKMGWERLEEKIKEEKEARKNEFEEIEEE